MTRITTFVLTLFLAISTAQAIEKPTFFDQTYGHWRVLGSNEPLACGAINSSKIATFALIQFMDPQKKEQELVIEIMAKWWEVVKDSGTVSMTFTGKIGTEKKNAEWERVDGRTIRIRDINQEKFLPSFADYKTVDIHLDNGDDARLPLGGTRNVISIMWDCIQQIDPNVASE